VGGEVSPNVSAKSVRNNSLVRTVVFSVYLRSIRGTKFTPPRGLVCSAHAFNVNWMCCVGGQGGVIRYSPQITSIAETVARERRRIRVNVIVIEVGMVILIA